MPRAPADVTERHKMVSGYYGRLLWQPQVSVRASISHSVGESKREGERGNETERERDGLERRTCRGRRVEKSAEEVRCGNKHALGVERGKRGEETSTKEVEREKRSVKGEK